MSLNLRTAHLLSVAIWVGVLAVEVVIEILAVRRPPFRRAAAAFHHWIDLTVELPLVAAVGATGVLLLSRRPIDARLAVKIAASGVALAAALACVAVVVARHRGPDHAITRRTRLVFVAGGIGFASGTVALGLGLHYAGWL